MRASTETPSARQEIATVNRDVNFMMYRSTDEVRECGKNLVVGFIEWAFLDYLMGRHVSANVRADRLFDAHWNDLQSPPRWDSFCAIRNEYLKCGL